MKMSELRDLSPELADIIKELSPHITAGAVYDADGNLVHGATPVDPPGAVWVSDESYLKMRAYAATDPNARAPRSRRD